MDALCNIQEVGERFRQMYKYCLVLFQKELEYTLTTLKREEFKDIDYSKLVTSFADINTDDHEKVGLILSFLEKFCIRDKKCKDKSVHNMAFYMTYMLNPDIMVKYLESLEKAKERKEIIYLDLEYAFNQCNQWIIQKESPKLEKTSKKGKIIIYGILGLYEKAVNLALSEKDFDSAKRYATKSLVDQKLKKNLWLKIAKEVLGQTSGRSNEANPSVKDITDALALLDEAKDVLRIDDLLPFFPDATRVETLKDKLCDSLKNYNDKINNLKNELFEQSKNAEDLREKNRKFKNKFISVHPTQSCEICYDTLLSQTFYAFHCGHGFHRECLINDLETYETKNYRLVSKVTLLRTFAGEIRATRSKAEFLKNEETKFDPQDRAMSWITGFAMKLRNSIAPTANEFNDKSTLSHEDQRKVEDLYSQIDMRLKEECYLCGEMLLDALDNDIAMDEEEKENIKYMYHEQKTSWEIE